MGSSIRSGDGGTFSSGTLRRLLMLRSIETGVLALVGVAGARALALPVPVLPWVSVIAALAVLNLFTWWRSRQPWPVADGEQFAQLLADVLAITVLLYYSGGSTNPLVSFYLVPLVLAAISLSAAFTWTLAGVCAGSYTFLMFRYHPLMPQDGDFATAVYLHLTGMWLTFVLSALLISYFVLRMRAAIQRRDHELAEAREETLRNERIVALGTLAAGAAHELGTPLATMAVVTGELLREHAGNPALVEDLQVLRGQVDNCKHILTRLLASAGQRREEDLSGQGLDAYFGGLLEQWTLVRPGVPVRAEWHGETPAPRVVVDQTLSQALMNLLNNAADASPHEVAVEGSWDAQHARLRIRDRGPGLTPEQAERAGQPFFTTKGPGHGIGIGLFLANATVERYGGTVSLVNREGGGALTEVVLPLEKLTAGVTPADHKGNKDS